MEWLNALERLHRANQPCVLLTVAAVRGHAPRRPGAKMVVTADQTWGSIGGGNVEATAIARARALLEVHPLDPTPQFLGAQLNPHVRHEHGQQCCGGEVDVLIEPLPNWPTVAVFGVGHVGLELARVLARQPLRLCLVDSRPDMVADQRLAVVSDAVAAVETHAAIVPEAVLDTLPEGSHLIVMTHDHAEDFALLDASLRRGPWGSVGVIGSSAKWARFRGLLAEAGHSPDAIASVDCPVGIEGITSKEPAAIAVAIAARLLQRLA